jgi:hypothetical protein
MTAKRERQFRLALELPFSWLTSQAFRDQLPATQSPDFPPCFSSTFTLVIVIPRSTALHMSYTVSSPTCTAVSASISTPVRPTVSTRTSQNTPSFKSMSYGSCLHRCCPVLLTNLNCVATTFYQQSLANFERVWDNLLDRIWTALRPCLHDHWRFRLPPSSRSRSTQNKRSACIRRNGIIVAVDPISCSGR